MKKYAIKISIILVNATIMTEYNDKHGNISSFHKSKSMIIKYLQDSEMMTWFGARRSFRLRRIFARAGSRLGWGICRVDNHRLNRNRSGYRNCGAPLQILRPGFLELNFGGAHCFQECLKVKRFFKLNKNHEVNSMTQTKRRRQDYETDQRHKSEIARN